MLALTFIAGEYISQKLGIPTTECKERGKILLQRALMTLPEVAKSSTDTTPVKRISVPVDPAELYQLAIDKQFDWTSIAALILSRANYSHLALRHDILSQAALKVRRLYQYLVTYSSN